MKTTKLPYTRPIPYTIRVLIIALGVDEHLNQVSGLLKHVGANTIDYNCPKYDGICKPSFHSKANSYGSLDFEVGCQFEVNAPKGKSHEQWRMVVAFESNSTYTVYLTRAATGAEALHAIAGVVLDEVRDVTNAKLSDVVRSMHDRAIEKYSDGAKAA